MKKTLALLTVMSAFTAAPAFAEDVIFNGTVDSACTITVTSPGSLTANAAVTELASGAAGAGTFSITANASIFNLAVTDPTGWDAEPATTATTFASSAFLLGDEATEGSDISVPNGTTEGTVELTATATSGTFPNGTYTATVDIICS